MSHDHHMTYCMILIPKHNNMYILLLPYDYNLWVSFASVDACMKAGVKHVVYSGLEKVKDITGWECPHFDGKGEVEDYLDEISLPNTSVYDSHITMKILIPLLTTKNRMMVVTLLLPAWKDQWIVWVCRILELLLLQYSKNSENYIGKRIGLSGDRLTTREYMDIFAGVTGKKIQLNEISPEEFAKFPFPGAADLAAMYHFYANGNPVRDQLANQRAHPENTIF